MPIYKGDKKGTWVTSFYYKDWQGNNIKKMKRGFLTKKEAQVWTNEFLQKESKNLNMNFESFIELYIEDIKTRLKLNTWLTKETIIRNKILPYFKDRKINEIKATDIIKWQNIMINYRNEKGEPYSPVYLKTIHNQLSAIFNHAVKFYELNSNPCKKAGKMGKDKSKEMLFWTKEEYLKFIDVMMEKPTSYYSFQMLYWCGIRVGELLALTPKDFDFDKKTVSINKSYQRLEKEDYITTTKTEKSNRVITMPDFLCEEIAEYIESQYKIKDDQRIFDVTKSYLQKEMKRGSKLADVKKIRVHDLRHSHASLLIDMGFSVVAIAERLGHEGIDITFRYAHLFPTKQREIADKLTMEG